MEEENTKKRNIRPAEKSNLPVITLVVLVMMVLALLYVGYEYIADDTSGAAEFTNIVPDTTSTLKPSVTEEEATTDIQSAEPEVTTPDPAKLPEQKPAERSQKPADLGGTEITHTVKAGETFMGIANRYNLKLETLKSLNPEISDITKDLKSDVTRLKVRVKAVHTVGPGDVLRVVAGKYGVSKELLMAANGKSRDISERGEKLVIPFPDKK